MPNQSTRPRLDYNRLRRIALAAWADELPRRRPGSDFACYSAGLTTTCGPWHGHARVDLIRRGDVPSEHDTFAIAEICPRTFDVLRLAFAFEEQM